MDLYMAIFTAMGVANTPLSIVATYGKTLVKLYAIVTEVLIVMDNTGMEDKVAEALKELACNVNKEIMFFALGKVGEVMGGLDLMISLMVEKDFLEPLAVKFKKHHAMKMFQEMSQIELSGLLSLLFSIPLLLVLIRNLLVSKASIHWQK